MLKLLSVSLRLQSLIDWLVSVDDEGDYDIYEDEVGHLHETDEEYENGWIGRGEDNPNMYMTFSQLFCHISPNKVFIDMK